MARLEIPSIVVHNGSSSAPGSPSMEREHVLDKQAELEVLGSGRADELSKEESRIMAPTEADDKPPPPRVRSHSKVKLLVRSHAVREETSPPPDPDAHHQHTQPPTPVVESPPQPLQQSHNLSVNRPSSRHKLRHQGSSQGSMDSSSPCLSRDSSTEQYTDSTGVDLHQFISETLNRNTKDRMMLLKIEQELINLARDSKRTHHKFPPMSSYQRMLVHRVAAYLGMDHNVDTSGSQVIVNRTKATRVPELRFRELIRDELLFPEEPRRSILKRDSSSFEENFKSPERQFSSEPRRSKSFEEREEEYEKVRKRIFHRDDGVGDSLHDSSRRSSQEELRWPGDVQPWSSSDSDTSGLRSGQLRPARLLKVESFEGRDTLKANSLRLSVSKSYSFGGYPVSVLARSDSSARLLTKQDSGSSMSSRLSPSSSGYKSQSQRSDTTMSATPSPTATPVSQMEPQTVMWAVTSMAAVPPGSILINPQTGQPYTNPDGSIYRYDPANPPKISEDNSGSSLSSTNSVIQSSTTVEAEHSNKKAQTTTSAPSASPSPSKVVSSPNVTTTATSPSLPLSPQPVPTTVEQPLVNTPPSVTQAPVLTVCHSGQCSYVPHPSEQQQPPHQHPSAFQQAFPSSEVLYGNQQPAVQPPAQQPMMYTGFNVVHVANASNGNGSGIQQATSFEQRHPTCNVQDASGMSVAELGNYFMGLGVVADQRAGGDSNHAPAPTHSHYQPAPYWQPQQPPQQQQQPAATQMQTQQQQQQPQQQQQQHHHHHHHHTLPLYYVPSGVVNSSPPQQQAPPCGSSTPRYVTYPPYQTAATPHQDRSQAALSQNGGYIGYPVASYGATAVPAPVLGTGNGECVPLYTQPSLHMLYSTPTSLHMNTLSSSSTSMVPAPNSTLPYYHHHHATGISPYVQPGQPSYRTPTPPQTPTQNQTLCNVAAHPFMYLNGASYGPVYNGTGPGSGNSNGATPGSPFSQQPPGAPSTPGPAQYIPPTLLPNLPGLFRTNVQMVSGVRSSPPPRPPRDGTGSKPPYSRSPSVCSKDRSSGHYDVCGSGDKAAGMRYPSFPVLGLRIMPGDMRLVGPPLSTPSPALRVPFPLPPHRVPYQGGSQADASGRPPKARKPRSKVTVSMPANLSRSSQPRQMTPASSTLALSSGSGGEGSLSGAQDPGHILMLAENSSKIQH
ncbi:cAMP-regulated phosphoprotein 21 isoform X2 [Anabrus simplex]|uniref:cAMP-regulated phosphoprotein 21 isoform X2 n=2 Tax=Anabrus simplex TaxID=316456 RepID=UPI0035A31B62